MLGFLKVASSLGQAPSERQVRVQVRDIDDNAPTFLKDYRPVLPEHTSARTVVEVLATDDDDRSKSNGPPFIFRMDPSADDVIRASFKVEHDQSAYRAFST